MKKKENWSKVLEGTKAIILNEETDEKVVIEIPKSLIVIDMLIDEICSFESFMENEMYEAEGGAFDIGYKFLQEQFLELSKPFFEINEEHSVDFYEPSEEEKSSGIYTKAILKK